MQKHSILGLLLLGLLSACSSSEECSVAQDCDDSNQCTEDRCRLGHCSNLVTPYCCQTDTDCTDADRKICDADKGQCVQCLDDQDCPGRCLDQTLCVECLEHADCSGDQECDPRSLTCKDKVLVPGQPCTDSSQCESGWCLTEAGTGSPGGFCGQVCSLPTDCVSGVCIDIAAGVKTCLAPCNDQVPCREEYMCLHVGMGVFGCFPNCTQDSHCPVVGQCNPWVGMCGPVGPGADNGAPCLTEQDCKGWCVTEEQNGAPGGVCTSVCTPDRPSCPGTTDRCVMLFSPYLFGQTVCQPPYQPPTPCRDHDIPMVAFDIANQTVLGVCQPGCKAGGCQADNCNINTGLCSNAPDGPGDTGEPCVAHENCKGICMNFWPGGYCSSPCDVADPVCDAGGSCMNLGVHWSCAVDCQTDQDCRHGEEYFCHPDLKVCVAP